MTLGGEDLYFTPESPSEFATAITTPLQPDRESRPSRREKAKEKSKAKRDEDDEIIEQVVAKVRPLRSIDDDDDILTPGLLSGIIVIAVVIFAALVGVTVLV
jgi:hypothetical protein